MNAMHAAASTLDADTVDPRDPYPRIEAFLDAGTVTIIDETPKSGIVTASGKTGGQDVIVFCADARVQGGAMGVEGCRAIVDAYEIALEKQLPIVGIWHSGGARLAEGVVSLHAVGAVFAIMTRASGKIPQISIVVGAAAGGAAYGPALTDIVIMAEAGRVFVTGPDVVRSVTGENVDAARLGGVEPHGRRSGVVHITTVTQEQAFERGRSLVQLLANQGSFNVDAITDRDLAETFPQSAKRAYDVHPLIDDFVDDPSDAVELHTKWAPNVVTTLGRLGGRTVGIIANNPMRLGGCLDSPAAEKTARFVRMCDAFGVPLVVIVDVPGYLPGVGQEWDGVVRRGAKLLHAFAESVVPRVTLVTRKTYGGAYIAMNSRSLGATKVFAWPSAEVAVMGHVAAVRILHRRRLAEVDEADRSRVEEELAAEHAVLAGGLERAQEIGVVDEVIEPTGTRTALARALAEAPAVRGEHGNIPL